MNATAPEPMPLSTALAIAVECIRKQAEGMRRYAAQQADYDNWVPTAQLQHLNAAADRLIAEGARLALAEPIYCDACGRALAHDEEAYPASVSADETLTLCAECVAIPPADADAPPWTPTTDPDDLPF